MGSDALRELHLHSARCARAWYGSRNAIDPAPSCTLSSRRATMARTTASGAGEAIQRQVRRVRRRQRLHELQRVFYLLSGLGTGAAAGPVLLAPRASPPVLPPPPPAGAGPGGAAGA